ncbi:rcc01693 family protein [Rhodopseudomonas telluris]|uniref:Rcc01693 family protein n=1 Tax=Rhodopseudomonas telluris TaxID=644215 RepID=A0ABV6ETR4_9BRAD
MTPFPWAEAMQFGFGVLRLSPDHFWRMTPRELAAALTGARGGITAPLDRGGLDALMRRFPDQEQAR